MYVSKPFGGEWGGGGGLHDVHYVFLKKKVLSAHCVPTTCAHTPVLHRVQEHVACPSWGASPWGPETWVMEVVEVREVKEVGLIALVRGTIKVVLLFIGRIACRTGSFLCRLKKSVSPLALFGPLPGGLQWPCPTIPLCSGLRFSRWHGWGMRCCAWCRVGGGGGGGRAIVGGGIFGERCRGRSGRVSHFLLLCAVLQGTKSHLRTHASSSSGTRRLCGMGALGWAASKWAAYTTKRWLRIRGNSQAGWCKGWPWLPLTFGSKRSHMVAMDKY